MAEANDEVRKLVITALRNEIDTIEDMLYEANQLKDEGSIKSLEDRLTKLINIHDNFLVGFYRITISPPKKPQKTEQR